MSSAGTVTGKGFVISYSVQSNSGYYSYGGYSVTIDSVVASHTASSSDASSNPGPNTTASDKHKFFNTKIALAFTTGRNGAGSGQVTGSGSMKYILGS